jgi:hypothetical protein
VSLTESVQGARDDSGTGLTILTILHGRRSIAPPYQPVDDRRGP